MYKRQDKYRIAIVNAVNTAWHDSEIHTFEQLEASLKASGVELKYKYRRGTEEIQGLSFICKGKCFPASKIDRRFSFGSIKAHLAKNKPLHPQSRWMYADGTNPDAPAQSQGHNNFGLYGGASQSPTEEGPCTVSGGATAKRGRNSVADIRRCHRQKPLPLSEPRNEARILTETFQWAVCTNILYNPIKDRQPRQSLPGLPVFLHEI